MNDAVNNAFPLPVKLSKEKLDADLETCLRENWKEHFNQRDYSGEWSVISLRSQTGNAQDIFAHDAEAPYQDTPLMEKCNYFREIVNAFQFEKESVRLLRLKPGSVIHSHRDVGLAYRFDCFRLHIPILTDAAVAFLVGGQDLPMQKGECWYADFDLPHSVKNDSAQERIHLVIDGKRNAWTDELFREAGYDFEFEKRKLRPEYDEATLNGMIEGLEKIGTETSRQMIAELLERKKKAQAEKINAPRITITKDHIPAKLVDADGELRFRWMYAGAKRFTEPFFQETLLACKFFPENKKQLPETSVEEFLAAANEVDAPEPSAFIFHVSRCGSTLLAQLFATSEQCIILSETPLLDDILRLPYSHGISEEISDSLFKAAIRLLARRYSGKETHLIIKCDSWHTMFYERIRRCYPEVPIVLLYRSPKEVMRSHAKEPGMQFMPGVIQPEIFGMNNDDVLLMRKENYFANVLANYFQTYLKIIQTDKFSFPLSYHEGTQAMFECVATASGFHADEEMMNNVKERSRYHSKSPAQLFSEEQMTEDEPEFLREACNAFREISTARGVRC
jgi:hypothetical protein